MCALFVNFYLLADGMVRMANMSKAKRTISINSDGWRNGSEGMMDDDDDDDDDEVPRMVKHQHPGSNEHVNVTAPDGAHREQALRGSEETFLTAEEEMLSLPGSFDTNYRRSEVAQEDGEVSWAGLFRWMGLRS